MSLLAALRCAAASRRMAIKRLRDGPPGQEEDSRRQNRNMPWLTRSKTPDRSDYEKDEKGYAKTKLCELRTIVLNPVYMNDDPRGENTRFWGCARSGESSSEGKSRRLGAV
jgi:hypothetical protein